MKKIYLLALAAIFGLNAMAQQKSNVVVFSEDGETFFAFLNGVKQNTTAQSNVKITGIPGEGASLRLVFANSSDQPLKQDLYFVEPNQEHTIKVKRDKKGVLKMRYFGAVALTESTSTAPTIAYTATEAPASNNTTTTNTTGTVNNNTTTTNTTGTGTVNMNMQVSDPNLNNTSNTTTTTTTTTTNSNTNGGSGNGSGSLNMNVGISENGLNVNMNVSGTETGENGSVNMNVSGMEGSETVTSSTTTTTTTSSSSSNGYSSSSSSTSTTNGTGSTGYTTASSNNYNNCSYAMDEASFSKMKGAIASNAFDDTKMSTAKTATKGNCVSTEQIKHVMALFSMDDDKLAYAKYAYDYTVDKNNFYLLGESLVYDGNKEELNKFIETKR